MMEIRPASLGEAMQVLRREPMLWRLRINTDDDLWSLARLARNGMSLGMLGERRDQTTAGEEGGRAKSAEENLSAELLQLIAYCVSLSAGCRYCQAHTGHNTGRASAAPAQQAERLAQVLNYETAECFTAAERAAIGLALAAGQVPNASDGEHFMALREHYSERQQVQIVAVISLFGFLNRWNDTLATTLEQTPTDFAQEHLLGGGWQLSKHAAE